MRSRLRGAVAVTALFLRRYVFHPYNIGATLVLPVMIAFIFGAADAQAASLIPIGVTVESPSASTTAFIKALDAEHGVRVREYHSRDDLLDAVQRNDVSAGVIVPADFDATRAAGMTASVTIVGDPREPLLPAANSIVTSVGSRAHFAVDGSTVHVTELPTAAHAKSVGFPRAAAGMLVFWVFANALFSASLIAEDRARGVMRRIAGAPITSSSIVAGEIFGRFLITLTQSIIVAAFSTLVFGTEWGALLPFLVVLMALSAVAAGAAVLLGVLLRNPGTQAATFSHALLAVLGLAGGCIWSLANAPTVMQWISKLTPHAWALSAIDALVARGGGFRDIALDVVILASFATVLLALAAISLRRSAIDAGTP